MVLHIADAVGDVYVLGYWSEPELESYQQRYTVPVDALERFDVGAVLENVEGSRRTPDDDSVEPADDDVAQAVRDASAAFEERLEEYATEYGIDREETVRSFDDGDAVLMQTPPGRDGHGIEDTAYVTPTGLKSDGYWRTRDFATMENVPPSILESGMAFDVTELDDDVCLLEYDADETESVQTGPVQIEVMCDFERLTEVHDWVDTRSDFEPPFYVLVDGFDDGQFYSSLYDSGGEGDGGKDAVREICAASAYPAQTIPRDWPYSGDWEVVPVKELHLGDNEYMDRPVAVLDPDAEPVRP